MFQVNNATGAIVMNVGDTGSIEVHATRSDSEDWGEDDRAVFTVRNGAGQNIITRIYHLDDAELGNGVVLIQFHNDDTDDLDPGVYSWELRYVVNPYYDSNGNIVDGDIVRTPGVLGDGEPMSITLKAVQAKI